MKNTPPFPVVHEEDAMKKRQFGVGTRGRDHCEPHYTGKMKPRGG